MLQTMNLKGVQKQHLTRRRFAFWIIFMFVSRLTVFSEASGEFKFDQFRSFLNVKPPIETFRFSCNSAFFTRGDIVPDSKRRFTFTYYDPTVLFLEENGSDYKYVLRREQLHISAPLTNSPETVVADMLKVDPDLFRNHRSWGRNHGLYWTWFNKDAVVTELYSEQRTPTFGPAGGATASFELPFYWLNYGINGLGTNKVTWKNTTDFEFNINEIQSHVTGHFNLLPDLRPDYLDLIYKNSVSTETYRVVYTFEPNPSIPSFFPNDTQVFAVEKSGLREVGISKVDSLIFADSRINTDRIAPSLTAAGDKPHFVFTNGAFYAITLNSNSTSTQLQRLVNPTDPDSKTTWLRLTVILALILATAIVFLLSRKTIT
jgi:hypothetical protein